MGHSDGIFVAGRYEIVVKVTFNVLVAVFEVNIVGLVVIGFNPFVEIVLFGIAQSDNRFAGVGVIIGAGSEA